MIKTEIVNVVATASLGTPIDLEQLRKFNEIFHDSDVYGGKVAYFKTSGMCGKVSIFFSGKMISVGTKSEAQSFKELEIAQQFLMKKGYAKLTELKPIVQNIVAMVNFGEKLNLGKLCEYPKTIYEPEQFPGAILRLDNPFKVSVLLFASGKAVIAGLRSSRQIEPIISILTQIIKSNQ